MDYDANDLIKMWSIQDNFEDWAKKLTEAGMSLGVMVMSVELAKRMLDPRPIDTEELEEIRNRAIKQGVIELRKRLDNAGRSATTEE